MTKIRYTYVDSLGNTYQIGEHSFTFEPIMPLKSSNNLYTDGDPSKYKITKKQHTELVDLFDQAFTNRTFRLEKRTLESAEICITAIEEESEKKINSVFLAMRSPEKMQIETLLDQLKQG